MKNNEKIIDIVKDYSNDYNLDKKLKNMVLENNSNIFKTNFKIETGYKKPVKVELEISVTEKESFITQTVKHEALGIKVSVKTTNFKSHEGFDCYGSISQATIINEKGEKLKMFIDYKRNICGYTSNIKGLELKQYYTPNRGCSLIFHIYERYCRVTSPSYIFNSDCCISLENEIEKVEENFNNDIETFWEDDDATAEDEMVYLKYKSSGKSFERSFPTQRKLVDYNMPKFY